MTEKNVMVSNSKSFTTKSKKERLIPMTDRLYKVLSDRQAREFAKGKPTFVFERRSKPFNSGYASRKFKEMVRKAGLEERLHFHAFRHGYATNLLHANANPVHVQKLLGHANLSTTLKYIHVEKDDLVNAVKKLDSAKDNAL